MVMGYSRYSTMILMSLLSTFTGTTKGPSTAAQVLLYVLPCVENLGRMSAALSLTLPFKIPCRLDF